MKPGEPRTVITIVTMTAASDWLGGTFVDGLVKTSGATSATVEGIGASFGQARRNAARSAL